MNFVTLLQQHPLLRADLKSLGLSHNHMHNAAVEISSQLGGSEQFNLCYVMSALNRKEFVRVIDASLLARQLGITPSLAQAAVMMFAPWVDEFHLHASVGT